MKIKLPRPVTIRLPNGATVEYSATDVVAHMVRNGREFAKSNELERVRLGARLLEAFPAGAQESGDVSPADLEALRAALAKPSFGWSSIPMEVTLATGKKDEAGNAVFMKRVRWVAAPALDLLPLIDALLSA